MAQTLAQFGQRMFGLSRRTIKNANEVVQNAAVIALNTLTERTPVDSGKAISNWLIGLNYAPVAVIPPHVPGVKGTTRSENIRIAQEEGLRRISARKTSQTIYLANNVPYMERLNSGWSQQAPAGFVEAAIAEAHAYVQSVRLLANRPAKTFVQNTRGDDFGEE